jgi:hypothetical protein
LNRLVGCVSWDGYLLAITARLYQLQNDAEAILAQPVYANVGAGADESRELIVEMAALVEEKLDAESD